MPTLDRFPLTRRRLVQASAAVIAAGHAPALLAVSHAQDGDTSDLVVGNTAFALNLYDNLRASAESNLLVSPYSISVALAMTYAGAAGDTADQMAAALSFTLDQDDIPAAFRDLSDDLVDRGNAEADEDQGVESRGLTIANSLWGEETFPFSDDYMDLLDETYGAGLNLVDFQGEPEAAREEINDWVADNTEDRIQDIVPPNAITSDTRLVLANAIWFSGAWADPFDPDQTDDDDFTLLDGTTVTVSMMHLHESLQYGEGDGFQVVEFPYQGSGFAFTVILPDEGEFETVEASLDAGTLDDAIGSMTATNVRASLPRFTFEFGTPLAEPLQALGMTDAFDGALADFSGMVDGDAPDSLFISAVLHKAFIALDENGTEAAAATVVMMAESSAEVDEPIEVVIDRPFIFLIRDTETGTLLFVGRVLNPEA